LAHNVASCNTTQGAVWRTQPCGGSLPVRRSRCELVSGTFYLLMLALGMAAAAVAADLGAGLVVQLVVAAAVGGGAVVAWRLRKAQRESAGEAQRGCEREP